MKSIIRCIILFSFYFHISLFANINSEIHIIICDIDTLISQEYGCYYNFNFCRPCTSKVDYESDKFEEHIKFIWDSVTNTYCLVISEANGPYFKYFGKKDLDSINIFPPDSELVDNNCGSLYSIFNVTVDSLNLIIGNSYAFKTLTSNTIYVKLRIINFNIIDIINHKVEMVFLWAAQTDGSKFIETENLDTLEFKVPIVKNFNKCFYNVKNNKSLTTFKVEGNKFLLPNYIYENEGILFIYNISGKFLKKISLKKLHKYIDFENINKSNSILILNWKSSSKF